MQLRKYRWSRDYEAAEEELVRLLARKQIAAERWVADEFEDFAPHKHPKDKQLWCVEGSIQFNVNNQAYSLQAGDALELPANTLHGAVAGFSGCTIYESPPSQQNPTLSVEA